MLTKTHYRDLFRCAVLIATFFFIFWVWAETDIRTLKEEIKLLKIENKILREGVITP